MENSIRHDVFTIVERGDKSFWIKVGSAFVNKDLSYTVLLDALPLNGKLQIRPAQPRDEAGPARREA